MDQIVLQVQFPAELAAVTEARREITRVADQLGCARIDELALVVSELVANAVEHGQGPVTLCATHAPPHIRVDVHDVSDGSPRVQAVDLESDTGRGMQIVSALADQWGVVRHQTGKSVWADLRC